jgi:hypothetical protein
MPNSAMCIHPIVVESAGNLLERTVLLLNRLSVRSGDTAMLMPCPGEIASQETLDEILEFLYEMKHSLQFVADTLDNKRLVFHTLLESGASNE